MSEIPEFNKSTVREKSAHAWRTSVGFVPLFDRSDIAERVFTDRDESEYLWLNKTGGRESALARKYFEHKAILLDPSADPHQNAVRIRYDFDIKNGHREAVLDIGTNRAYGQGTENEFFHYLASGGSSAAAYSVAIDSGKRVLEVAGWNDGSEVDIDEVIEVIEAGVAERSFLEQDEVLRCNPAQRIATRALYHRGRVNLAHGDRATELSTYEDFSLKRRDRTIDDVEGNVLHVEVPFYIGGQGVHDYVPFHARNSPLPEHYRVTFEGNSHPLYNMVRDPMRVKHYLEQRNVSKNDT